MHSVDRHRHSFELIAKQLAAARHSGKHLTNPPSARLSTRSSVIPKTMIPKTTISKTTGIPKTTGVPKNTRPHKARITRAEIIDSTLVFCGATTLMFAVAAIQALAAN